MSAIGPKQTSLVAPHTSAFGGRADMPRGRCLLSRSLLGVAVHESASDPKRTPDLTSIEMDCVPFLTRRRPQNARLWPLHEACHGRNSAMTSSIVRATSRRRFLQFLAGSPLFASGAISAYATETPSKLPDPMIWAPATDDLIKSPKDAVNVFDFEPVARKNVPPAHFGYMASGIDDEVTLRANRDGFLKFQLRPRRLNDVSKVDMNVELFGAKYDSPIFVCPTGGNKFFHPDGEVAVAKAARIGNHLQILSTSSNDSVEDVTKARGAPIWFQLYASPQWEVAQALIKRAEAAGCPVLVATADRIGGRNQETLFRLMREDTRECSGCHDRTSFDKRASRRHKYDGIDL